MKHSKQEGIAHGPILRKLLTLPPTENDICCEKELDLFQNKHVTMVLHNIHHESLLKTLQDPQAD